MHKHKGKVKTVQFPATTVMLVLQPFLQGRWGCYRVGIFLLSHFIHRDPLSYAYSNLKKKKKKKKKRKKTIMAIPQFTGQLE